MSPSSRRRNEGPTVFIIEHPTRGTFREMDSDWRAGKRIDIPRFSNSGMRNDPDKAYQFRTLQAAVEMLERILQADGRAGQKCRVRRTPDYEALCPECGNWCNQWHDHKEQCSVYQAELERHGIRPLGRTKL